MADLGVFQIKSPVDANRESQSGEGKVKSTCFFSVSMNTSRAVSNIHNMVPFGAFPQTQSKIRVICLSAKMSQCCKIELLESSPAPYWLQGVGEPPSQDDGQSQTCHLWPFPQFVELFIGQCCC